MIVRVSDIEFQSQREKEIFLMILSEVNIGELRPEVHMECMTMLSTIIEEMRGLM